MSKLFFTFSFQSISEIRLDLKDFFIFAKSIIMGDRPNLFKI